MGKFSIERLNIALENSKNKYNTIIETGSLFGNGTEILAQHFQNVHTIEIEPELWKNVTARFIDNKNIVCHLGDSAEVIKELSTKIKDNCIFFLDAHWSGDSSVNWNNSKWCGYNVNTGCRNKDPLDPKNQNPLDEELKVIVNNFNQEVLIYIDDMEKFDSSGNAIVNCCFEGENWSHLSINKLVEIVQPRLENIYKFSDQIIFALKSK